MSRRLPLPILWIAAAFLAFVLAFVMGRLTVPASRSVADAAAGTPGTIGVMVPNIEPTKLYAHNLDLRKGPHFRVFVRWINGQLLRTNKDRNPSFDVPDSFVLEINKGVINVNYNDIADYLNHGESSGDSPLKNITVENNNGQLRLHGTVKKLIAIPVQMDGTVTPLPDGRIQYHMNKLDVLKLPMKGLLGAFKINLADLAGKKVMPGVEVSGNDMYLDTQRFLPPPHIHGRISSLTLEPEQVKVTYGTSSTDEQQLAQWHNFLRLVGGDLDFARLTMRQADLTLIDAGDDPWFDLDLANYQAQLVYGTTRITQTAGVEVYMPDLKSLPAQKNGQPVTIDWLKNRNTAPPPQVASAKKQ